MLTALGQRGRLPREFRRDEERGPASSSPPAAVARSRIPRSPFPVPGGPPGTQPSFATVIVTLSGAYRKDTSASVPLTACRSTLVSDSCRIR
jgi:hypothetical protein